MTDHRHKDTRTARIQNAFATNH